jgi:hypothetical protein
MAERRLPSRRKRASKGRVIRISTAVFESLDERRRGQSWDSFLRKLHGLEDRHGNPQILIEGMVEALTGAFFLKTPDTTWEKLEEKVYEAAFMAAAEAGLKRIGKPLKMRELP